MGSIVGGPIVSVPSMCLQNDRQRYPSVFSKLCHCLKVAVTKHKTSFSTLGTEASLDYAKKCKDFKGKSVSFILMENDERSKIVLGDS